MRSQQQVTDISKWNVSDIPDMTDKTVVITGANGGIGFALTQAFVAANANVVMVCRDEARGGAALKAIMSQYPCAHVSMHLADFSDLQSVNALANDLLQQHQTIDILYNNAGVLDVELALDENQLDKTFKTNYLSHVLLTNRLISAMKNGSRIVFTGSTHHQYGNVDWNDLQCIHNHKNRVPYNNSKFMLLMYCMNLHKRLTAEQTGIVSIAAHPGFVATNILTSQADKKIGCFKLGMFSLINKMIGQEPQVGVIPLLYAGVAADAKGGEYYGPGGWMEYSGPLRLTQCAPGVYRQEDAERLNELSGEMIVSALKQNQRTLNY